MAKHTATMVKNLEKQVRELMQTGNTMPTRLALVKEVIRLHTKLSVRAHADEQQAERRRFTAMLHKKARVSNAAAKIVAAWSTDPKWCILHSTVKLAEQATDLAYTIEGRLRDS